MQSEQLGELAAALAKAQGAIKGAVKASDNGFYKTKYADLPAVMDACRMALSSNGIAVVQTTDLADRGQADAVLVTTLIHSSGQWISGNYPIRPAKGDPQGFASAVTYARRYALMAIAGVVAENEDDDGEAAVGRDSKPYVPPAATKAPVSDNKAAPSANQIKAKKFYDDSIELLGSMKTLGALIAWEEQNKDKLAKIKDYVLPEEYNNLVGTITARRTVLGG
jgi:hypothetical protein